MSRRILVPLALVAFLWAGALFAAEWVPLSSPVPRPPQVTVISDTQGDTTFRVEVPGYYLEEIPVNGVPHTRILFPKSPRLLRAGDPELPLVAVSIAVPRAGTPRAEVIEEESRNIPVGRYLPSKGSLSRAIDPDSVPYIFSAAYSQDSAYPARGCEATEPYILRNVRGTAVAVFPVRVNPVKGELTICSRLTVRVRTGGDGGVNVLTSPVAECREFQQVYADHFANGAGDRAEYTPVSEAGGLLVITNDAFHDALLPLVYWKRQKGVPTEIVKLSEVGSDAAAVKACIQSRYDQGGLAYVLLAGDAGFMPYPLGTAGNVVGQAADPMYALLAGSDSYPDIVVSRFPAQTATEASTMANRVIRYEKTPQAAASWYGSATGIASAEGVPTDGARMDWLRADLMAYGYSPVDQIYDPGATAAQVTAAINAGRGIINYIGHGGETYWVTSGFGVSGVYALTNTDLMPFIFDVACVNGKFNRLGGDCFAEAWLKAGDPSAPKGALGIYAASTNQDWVPPCNAQGESVDLLVAESCHTFGTLCFNGVMKGLDMYAGTTGQQLFQQWHIFGDGSATVFTKPPAAMAVSHANGLAPGAMNFDVTVPGVAGALCALYDDASRVLYGSAATQADGTAAILLNAPPVGVQSLTLTVTAFNRVPYIATVQVGGDYLQVSAAASPTSGTWPLEVAFAGTVSGGTAPYSYEWAFGDGATSADLNPVHTYMGSGTFAVVFTARDAAGSTARDQHLSITIAKPTCTMTCSASVPSAGTAGTPVYFTASASGSAGCTGTTGFAWTFGDGEVSAQKNPSHTYAAAGTYSWTLTARMAGQICSTEGTLTIVAGCELACQAGAAPAAGDAPLAVSFTSSADAQNCSGAPAYTWNFGDGQASVLQNPTHTYASAGTFIWAFTAMADGLACSRTGTVTVAEPCLLACSASALPAAGDAPLSVSFSASADAQHCSGAPAYSWDFGDGQTSADQNSTHAYVSAGTFAWTLTVRSEDLTCSKTGTVTVAEPCMLSCEASAAPSAGPAPLAVAFSASADALHCEGNPEFAWDFGDGTASGEREAAHTYASAGTYTWTLTATVQGKTCSRTGAVAAAVPCTVVCQASVPVSGWAGTSLSFTAGATPSNCAGTPAFAWDFGDGTRSAEQNPSHAYATAGTYTWTMIVTAGGERCSQTGTLAVETPLPGDGNGDGSVSIGEVQQAITMFLGIAPPANGVDCDGDGAVSIGEVQKVVNAFLGATSGCS